MTEMQFRLPDPDWTEAEMPAYLLDLSEAIAIIERKAAEAARLRQRVNVALDHLARRGSLP
jgi:hypothetical protein